MARAFLTRAQRQVLDLALTGMTSPEIAAELGVARCSIDQTLARMRKRLGARSNIHLVAMALIGGAVSGDALARAAERGR